MCGPIRSEGEPVKLSEWKRSLCGGIEYPRFGKVETVVLPDRLAEEQPAFSGFVRYEGTFTKKGRESVILEVFVNGKSAGIQIVPPYRYDLTEWKCCQ